MIENFRAIVRPACALIGFITASIALAVAWWNGVVSLEIALGVWLAPAGLWGVDRTVSKHKETGDVSKVV